MLLQVVVLQYALEILWVLREVVTNDRGIDIERIFQSRSEKMNKIFSGEAPLLWKLNLVISQITLD